MRAPATAYVPLCTRHLRRRDPMSFRRRGPGKATAEPAASAEQLFTAFAAISVVAFPHHAAVFRRGWSGAHTRPDFQRPRRDGWSGERHRQPAVCIDVLPRRRSAPLLRPDVGDIVAQSLYSLRVFSQMVGLFAAIAH